jgi:hypothetical protein
MNTKPDADVHTALYSRVFKGLLLSEDIAQKEEAGQLLRSDPQAVNTSPPFWRL